MNPKDRKYSNEHEWVLLLGEKEALVGITDFAQEQLGDVVFVELPEPGTQVTQFQKIGEIESVKTVTDLYTPISGELVEVNPEVVEQPELVNQDPYGQGWLVRIAVTEVSELEDLLSSTEYDNLIADDEI
jgi:glycine cleavage system H protein